MQSKQSLSFDPSAKRIDRRTILRAMGVTLALPGLEVMKPLAVASEQVTAPVRLAWVFFPNGTNYDRWLPKGSGKDWEISPSLEPLAGNRNDFNILKGLAQVNAQSLGDGPGDHARSAAAFLTGAHPYKTAGSRIKSGQSVDQIAAEHYGRQTRLASLELGTEEGKDAGECDSGYACAYSNNISWKSATLPMGKEVNPKKAFQRLFGTALQSKSSPENQNLDRVMQKSILDFVTDQRKRLELMTSQDDRRKLDEYYSSIREMEQRLTRFSSPIVIPEGAIEPEGKPETAVEHIRLMYDLMVLAFQSDTTRIATFMLANEGSNRTFPTIEVKDGHHSLSHHENKQDNIDKIAKIDRFYAEQFSYFLNKLRETKDATGASLLDHSLIVFGGCISDGNRHDHHNLPVLLAGRGGQNLETGRLIEYAEYTPMNNLFSTMLDCVGMPDVKFGDSTGQVKLA
jgi:hypothetical protein